MKTSQVDLTIISGMRIYDQDGKPQLRLKFDPSSNTITSEKKTRDGIDKLVKAKAAIASDNGIEAYGALITGASKDRPLYSYLMTVYDYKDDVSKDKYHVVIESTLEQLSFHNSFLLAVECFAAIIDLLHDSSGQNKINYDKYPLLHGFFTRQYNFPPLDNLFNGLDIDGTKLQTIDITERRQQLALVLGEYQEAISAAQIAITTPSGAIVSYASIKGIPLLNETVHNLASMNVSKPGMHMQNGILTICYPYTPRKVGKIDRAIASVLNTISYAKNYRQPAEQLQDNTAYKFEDLKDIMLTWLEESQSSYGLTSSVGTISCSFKLKSSYENNFETISEIILKTSSTIKAYAQGLLGHIAKAKAFQPIIK